MIGVSPLLLDVFGAGIAAAALLPLSGVVSLVRSPGLKRAWGALILVVLLGISLLLASVIAKLGKPLDTADAVTGVLHILGPSFVFAVAWLSRNTAREMLRLATLEAAAYSDPLTSLGNRRRFDAEMIEAVRRAR